MAVTTVVQQKTQQGHDHKPINMYKTQHGEQHDDFAEGSQPAEEAFIVKKTNQVKPQCSGVASSM